MCQHCDSKNKFLWHSINFFQEKKLSNFYNAYKKGRKIVSGFRFSVKIENSLTLKNNFFRTNLQNVEYLFQGLSKRILFRRN